MRPAFKCLHSLVTTFFMMGLFAGSGAAQTKDPIKIGLLLSYKGVFASLSETVDNGWKLALSEFGGKVAGRDIEIIRADDEGANPTIAVQKIDKLIKSDKVNLVSGIISSGVGIAVREVAHRQKVPLVLTFAEADQLTNELCSPYVGRTSFAFHPYGYAFGLYFAKKYKTAATLAPDYAAGRQVIAGFINGFKAGGGKIAAEEWTAFRTTKDWGPYFTKLRDSGAEVIFSFYGGTESIQAVKTHADFGLKDKLPLVGDMWLYDEQLWDAMGDSIVGATYGTINIPSLPHAGNQNFVKAYKAMFNRDTDVNAVLGYENAKAILLAIQSLNGDISDGAKFIKALSAVKFDAPRGPFEMNSKNNDAVLKELYIGRIEKGSDGKLHQVLVERIPSGPALTDKCKLGD